MAIELPNGWQTLPLEDCMSAIIDYRGKTPRKTTHGVPLVTAKIVKGGRIETPNEFIDPNDFEDWMRRGLPNPGDIVITTEAPLGEVAQLGNERVALAQRLITLRGKPRLLDNTFLKFLMMSESVQSQLRGRSTGTTVVGIKQSELRKVQLSLPPLDVQSRIAAVLGLIDEKIEQGRRTSRELEELARAIFRAWFVDFEPVKAKAAGATAFPSMPQSIFHSLPTRLVNSELGPIPEGWLCGSLNDAAALSKAQVKPQDFPQETFDHFSIPAFDDGKNPASEFGESIKSNKFAVINSSILVSKLNPRIPRVWLPPLKGQNRQIASTEFLVTVPREGWDRVYLFGQVTQPEFRDNLTQGASGTSNSHQRATPQNFMSMQIVLSPQPLRRAFAELCNPMLDLCASMHAESRKLAELRDYLLPKLLSGTICVSAFREEPNEVPVQ